MADTLFLTLVRFAGILACSAGVVGCMIVIALFARAIAGMAGDIVAHDYAAMWRASPDEFADYRPSDDPRAGMMRTINADPTEWRSVED